MATSTYDRLKAQNRVLRKAIELAADPDNPILRSELAEALADPALPANDLGAAIEKALSRPAPVNLLKRDRTVEKGKRAVDYHDLTESIRKRREEHLAEKAAEPRKQQERRERIAKGERL